MINKDLAEKIYKELIIPNGLLGYEANVTEKQMKRIQELLEAKQYRKFYQTGTWRKVRADVLKEYNNECVLCRLEGKITTHDNRLNGDYRGLQVHHMLELEYRSAHKYCLMPIVNRKVNLIPICQHHHNLLHNKNEKLTAFKSKNKFTNLERW